MSSEVTPGQAACEAFWIAVGAGPDDLPVSRAWEWARAQKTRKAWEEAAKAAAEAWERFR